MCCICIYVPHVLTARLLELCDSRNCIWYSCILNRNTILRNKVIYRIPSRVRQVMNHSKTVSILFRTKTKWWNVKFFKRWGQKGPSKPVSQNFLANCFLYSFWFFNCWTQVFAIRNWITFKFFTINCETIRKSRPQKFYFHTVISFQDFNLYWCWQLSGENVGQKFGVWL